MRELQKVIVEEMGVAPTIDPAGAIEEHVQFLCDYAKATGAGGFVLGISGGVDSSLAGRLCQLAAERLREEEYGAVFVAVRLPYNVQHDEDDAQIALQFIQADEVVDFNVGPAVDGMVEAFEESTGRAITDYNKGNVKARARMVAQYALAGERRLLVVGTDHGAESVTGFFTKFGDGGADILPNFGFDKRQIRSLVKHLGGPESVWNKVPTADLLDGAPGQTDETELGITYDDIDDYLEGKDVDDAIAGQIEARWLSTRHKRTTPVSILDTWWR
ncbi:ammonia-dependent NAD(+) synthetase [Kocuria coralli]|uniref:NH(3)-dependent NAD(+) synthetase n=1 Tax=Kocuria coralli TaxID=1461025 RepID=A0A5J5KW76_9MICC|nr:ammonia-dependent NAD(+) synthetase [Kocuria coralli]KAA9393899.1 ammonia-dependent NAD(+) synthetase [Kocuria coralli]